MPLANVKNNLYFRIKPGGSVMNFAEVRGKLGNPNVPLTGVNFYYGINDQNVGNFGTTQLALNSTHNAFFQQVLNDLQAEPIKELTVVFGLQPPKFKGAQGPESHAKNPFSFVMTQTPLLIALANELKVYRQQAKAFNKNLRIIIRYASEMNDLRIDSQNRGVNAWGQQPVLFRASFELVHDTMKSIDPDLQFAFSPAIRRDLHPGQRPEIFTIAKYYPGDDLVDVVSGTWYVGTQADLNLSADLLMSHMLLRKQDKVIFGIDEVGGFNNAHTSNPKGPCDPTLKDMMAKVKALGPLNVKLDYVTFFMQDGNRPWSKAQLSFL